MCCDMKFNIDKRILKESAFIGLIIYLIFISLAILSEPKILVSNIWVYLVVLWAVFINPTFPMFISSYFGLRALDSKNKNKIFIIMPLSAFITFLLTWLLTLAYLKINTNYIQSIFGRFIYIGFMRHLGIFSTYSLGIFNILFFGPIAIIILGLILAVVLKYYKTGSSKRKRKK